jgi:hypothetical protein
MPTFQPKKWLTTIMVGNTPDQHPTSKEEWDTLVETATANRVISLCYHQIANTPIWEQCPDWFCEALKRYTHQIAANEMAQSHELEQVLAQFAKKEIFPLLMKGAPLSYSLYPQPYLRERCDTDILFRSRDQAHIARDLLTNRGYQQPNAVSGNLVSNEFICYRTTGMGITHNLDMHWHLNNDYFFANAFGFEELAQNAISVPNLGKNARSLGPVHALLLACMHRIAHLKTGEGNLLFWLYDIHLFSEQFSEEQWEYFEKLTIERNLENSCLDSLKATRKAFDTKIPENILQALKIHTEKGGYAPQNASYIWQTQLMNYQSLPGWREKIQLLREHLFPAPDYMVEKYQIKHASMLPAFYALRITQGIPKLFRSLK